MTSAIYSCALILGLTNVSFGLSALNESCLVDRFKPYKDLLQQVSLYRENNSKILESNSADFGIKPKEVSQIRSALGEVLCPGTKHGNPAQLSGAIFESGTTLVTNLHAFIDDDGVPREPLSECTFTTQEELSAGLPGHHFEIGSGVTAMADAMSQKHFAMGSMSRDQYGDDWLVIKLKTAPTNVVPFKLPAAPPDLHECKVGDEANCQKLISVTAHTHIMPDNTPSPWGKTVVQSFNLYDMIRPQPGSGIPNVIFTNQSAIKGMSGGIAVLTDVNGHPVKINGSFVPVGMTATATDQKRNFEPYSRPLKNETQLVGFDGNFANAIRTVAGSKVGN